MGTLIDWLIKAWESGNVATLAFAALLLGGFKLNSILSLAQHISGRRRRFLVDALKQEGLDATTRAFLLEELNAVLVQCATGIAGNQVYRSTVLALIARSMAICGPASSPGPVASCGCRTAAGSMLSSAAATRSNIGPPSCTDCSCWFWRSACFRCPSWRPSATPLRSPD
ncbi:hypothetical protein [Ralstonia syzygii]|uniref:hypothetical protein n=1 Tax=Ralstonia syzygii TaxID=28097 RepID=UPI0036F34CFB